MKKTLLIALSIVLMLFAFASCDNNSGNPGFEGDTQQVANQLKPADLVKDVLKSGAKGVTVEYELIPAATSSAKAAVQYTLKATVTFTDYETAAGKIISGVLVYMIPGTVDNGRFTATGSCTITTEAELVVETGEGNVPVEINDSKATVSVTATVGADNKVDQSSVTATVTVSAEIETTVDGDPVKTPAETKPEPVVPTISTSAELLKAFEDGGTYKLSDNVSIETTSGVEITKNITLDLNQKELKSNVKWVVSGASVTLSNGTLSINDANQGYSNSTVELNEGSVFTLNSVTYTSNVVNIFCVNNENNVTVNINDSTVTTTTGYYAIGTNATPVESQEVLINIKGSTISTVGSTNDCIGDNTALFFNVLGRVTIENSTISGDKHAVMLRGGGAD